MPDDPNTPSGDEVTDEATGTEEAPEGTEEETGGDSSTEESGQDGQDDKDGDAEVIDNADNPDAVKAALDAERTTAREALKAQREAEEEAETLSDKLTRTSEELTSTKSSLTAAEDRATTAESDLLRLKVALDKGIDPNLASRLNGTTKEELEADADTLAGAIGPGGGAPRFDGGPRPTPPVKKDPVKEHNSFLTGLFGTRGEDN